MARIKMDARFFDDSATDPHEYPADKFAEYFRSFIKDGVFKDLERFKTTPGEGMQIVTAPGIGWVQGYWCKNFEPATFDAPPAHSTLTRIDMLVMQLDRTDAQGVFLEYKAGEPGSPTPVLEHTANIWEVALYRITVPAGLTEITAANIKDERVEATSYPQEDTGKKGGGGAVNTFYYTGSPRIARLPLSKSIGTDQWAKLANCNVNSINATSICSLEYEGSIYYLTRGSDSSHHVIKYNPQTDTWTSVADRANSMGSYIYHTNGFAYGSRLYIAYGCAVVMGQYPQATINTSMPGPSYLQYYDVSTNVWGGITQHATAGYHTLNRALCQVGNIIYAAGGGAISSGDQVGSTSNYYTRMNLTNQMRSMDINNPGVWYDSLVLPNSYTEYGHLIPIDTNSIYYIPGRGGPSTNTYQSNVQPPSQQGLYRYDINEKNFMHLLLQIFMLG